MAVNEQQLPVVKFKSDSAARLAVLATVDADLECVVSCCERMQGLRDAEQDSVLLRAMWTAALVAYVRAIWDPRREWLRSRFEQRIAEFEGEPLDLHAWLKDMRDKHVAHDVNPFSEFLVGLILPPETVAEGDVQGVATFGRIFIGSAEQAKDISAIARALRSVVSTLYDQVRHDVQAEASAIGLPKLRKLERLRSYVPGPESATKPRRQ